jgi:hypothetical protein
VRHPVEDLVDTEHLAGTDDAGCGPASDLEVAGHDHIGPVHADVAGMHDLALTDADLVGGPPHRLDAAGVARGEQRQVGE